MPFFYTLGYGWLTLLLDFLAWLVQEAERTFLAEQNAFACLGGAFSENIVHFFLCVHVFSLLRMIVQVFGGRKDAC